MLKHRPVQNHYDFELEAGTAKHCLGVKIVDIAMFKFNSVLCYTTEVPYQFARATCTMHPFTLSHEPSN